MEKISIHIETLDWTMGETVGLRIMPKEGSTVYVSWGDGKVQTFKGKQLTVEDEQEEIQYGNLQWFKAGHAYPEKGCGYTIIISTDDDGGIVGFDGCNMFEVKTVDLNFKECPGLRLMRYSGYGEEHLDVSHNPLLEYVNIHEINNTKLDFSANPQLKFLALRGAKDLTSLNLSKNDQLRHLDIFLCHNLQHLALSNQSVLSEVDFALTALRPRDLEHLKRTMERNKPYKICGGSMY